MVIKITFKESKSKNYPSAIKLAERMGYRNEVLLSGEDILQNWDDFNRLFWMANKWSGFSFYLDGVEMIGKEVNVAFYKIQSEVNRIICERRMKVYQMISCFGERMINKPEEGTDEWANWMIEEYENKMKFK